MIEIIIARFIVGLAILAPAAYSDLKTREVKNVYWWAIFAFGFFFFPFEFQFHYIILILVSWIIFYLLFQFKLLLGGADVKAFMALVVLTPYLIFDIFFYSMLLAVVIVVIKMVHDPKFNYVKYPIPLVVAILAGFLVSNILYFFEIDLINLIIP